MTSKAIGLNDSSSATPGSTSSESNVPYLVMVNLPPGRWSFPVRPSRQIIGRSAKVQIRIPSQFSNVSRRHAEIWCDEDRIWIRDLNSQIGTRVNNIWLRPLNTVEIEADDRIWLGGVELEVVAAGSCAGRCEGSGNDQETNTWGAQFSSRKVLEDLTSAELGVLLCMQRGKMQDDEIGQELDRSPHTVRTQLASIYQKVGVHSRGELLGWLTRAGRASSIAS